MEKQSKTVVCTTLLVETSPQALPLGCACIASAIKNFVSDANVKVIDFSFEDEILYRLNDDEVAKEIATQLMAKNPGVLCFSVYMWNRHILVNVAKEMRKKRPEILFLAGGAEVTASPNSFIDDEKNPFDCLICGEGESSVSVIVRDFLEKGKKPTDKIKHSEACNLESLESPYLDGTLDASKYSGALWELARGCPYACSYCYESKGEKKVRYIPNKRLYEELDYFVNSEISQVFVLDPTYNVDKKRALEILHCIEKKAPQIFFHFECRPEFIDAKLAKAFSKILCSLQIGLQSSSERVLSLVKRTFNKKEFVQNINLLNEAGIVFGFDLIYGLPGDNYDGFMKSIDFALELYPNHLELFQLSVLPGTDLFDRAIELKVRFLHEAPYWVQETPTFSKRDIERAKKFSLAASIFYTQGRAVPWFLALLKPLQIKPTAFLQGFLCFLEERGNVSKKNYTFWEIVKIQKDFIKMLYIRKNVNHLIRFACDVIDLNAAISAYIADGTESKVSLNYHPDDLLSPYSQDPKYFVQHGEKLSCIVEVSKRVEESTGDLYAVSV